VVWARKDPAALVWLVPEAVRAPLALGDGRAAEATYLLEAAVVNDGPSSDHDASP